MTARQKTRAVCEKLIFWLIVAIPFMASFSSAAVDACIAVLIVSFIFKRFLSGERSFVFHSVFIAFLILILIASLSFVNTMNMKASLQGMTKLLKYGFLLVIVFFEVRDVRHIQKIIMAAVAGLLLISLDGIYQLMYGVDLLRQNHYNMTLGVIRLSATFPHTNIFAGYLALFIPAAIPLVLYYAKGKERTAGLVVVVLALFCLALTFCRSAVLGVFLVSFLMSLVRKDKVIFLLLLLCALAAPFMVPGNVKDWSKTTNSWAEKFLNKDRLIIYETSLNMIKHHPFIGVGVNTFSQNYQQYKLRDAIFDPGDENVPNQNWYAHNSYLHMTAETGIFYFLAFLILLFMLFRESLAFYRHTGHAFLKVCSLGIMMGLFAFLVHGLTETNLYYPKIAVLFWFQVALLMAVMRVGKEEALLNSRRK
jgi:putative inorganic carbon (HCO3(-)) transporter